MQLGLGLGLGRYKGETNLAGEANVFQDAAVAYSLRDLNLGVTSNVVRVRRSTDNLEQDFTATQVTDGSLTTFCGAGNGFVSVWYNQTGANNAIQPTATRQPRIVNSGVLETKLGKPAIYMTQAMNLFIDDSNGLTAENGIESYVVFSLDNVPSNASNSGIFGKWGGNLNEYAFASFGTLAVSSVNTLGVQTNTFTNLTLNASSFLFELKLNETKQEIFYNSNLLVSDNIIDTQVSNSKFSIGTYNYLQQSLTTENSYYQDLIVFKTLNTGKQSEIRQNINNYYAIY